jgi:hypothetical protein
MSDEMPEMPTITPLGESIPETIKAELDALIEQANIEMGRPPPGADEEQKE